MSTDLTFDLDFPVGAGACIAVSPLVRRIVADNPGPYTFTGTCSYIVGRGQVAIVDPGPDLPEPCRGAARGRARRDRHAYRRLAHPPRPLAGRRAP